MKAVFPASDRVAAGHLLPPGLNVQTRATRSDIAMGKKKKDYLPQGAERVICRFPKVTQRYEILERLECGMVLLGSEVKSLRQGRADLDGAYAQIVGEELFLVKFHIPPYEQAGPAFAHEPKRKRKLLAHRREIERLTGKIAQQGFTLVPTLVYFKNGRAKVELGLAKGKRIGDERHAIREKAELREAKRAMERKR